MMKLNGVLMTEGVPWQHTLRFALPVLAGMLLQQLHFGGTFPLTDKRETIPREASLFFTE